MSRASGRLLPGWATLALLSLGTLVLRLPFLTPRLAHWDAVNYALGLHDFDVAAHQPHPPGSPYFILVGRAALALIGDDNTALILVSLVASVAAVLADYALARLLFGRRAGLVAAVILMTQPIFLGYGTMANSWTMLACLAAAIGCLCVLLRRHKRWLVVPSAVFLGLASGFRLDVTAFLAPLWAWSVWTTECRPWRRVAAFALVPAGILVWLLPVAASSGGLVLWWERQLALLPPADRTPDVVAHQLLDNSIVAYGTLALTIGPVVVVSLISDRRAASQWLDRLAHSETGLMSMLWIAPAFVFLWLIDSTEPGHDLVFIVAVCALAGGLIVACARSLRSVVVCGGTIALAQVMVFLYAAPLADRPPTSPPNYMLLNITAPGLRQQQTSLADSLHTIRAQFDPRDSVVLTVTGQDPYRFMMYYLPEYLVLRLDPQVQSVLPARGDRQGNWTQVSDCLFSSGEVRHAVFVLLATSVAGIIPSGATRFSNADDGPFQVWEVGPGPETPDYLGFRLGGHCASV